MPGGERRETEHAYALIQFCHYTFIQHRNTIIDVPEKQSAGSLVPVVAEILYFGPSHQIQSNMTYGFIFECIETGKGQKLNSKKVEAITTILTSFTIAAINLLASMMIVNTSML